MLKPLLLASSISIVSNQVGTQQVPDTIDDIGDLVIDLLSENGDIDLQYGASIISNQERRKLSFGDELHIAGKIGEFHYYTSDHSGVIQGAFSLDSTSIPSDIFPQDMDIPDGNISGNINAKIAYESETFDYIFPLYRSEKLTLQGGVGISRYDFTLRGRLQANGGLSGEQLQIDQHFTAQRKSFYSPAIMGAVAYTHEQVNGNILHLGAHVRYEIGLLTAGLGARYDIKFSPNFSAHLGVSSEYTRYHSSLDAIDGFGESGELGGQLGLNWGNLSGQYDIREQEVNFNWSIPINK